MSEDQKTCQRDKRLAEFTARVLIPGLQMAVRVLEKAKRADIWIQTAAGTLQGLLDLYESIKGDGHGEKYSVDTNSRPTSPAKR